MAGQSQIQEQRLAQQQRLAQTVSQQQLLQAQLTELPIAQLLERVDAELDDNPALERTADDYSDNGPAADDGEAPEPAADDYQSEQRQSALSDALESLGRDDEDLPVYSQGRPLGEEREEMVYGETQ